MLVSIKRYEDKFTEEDSGIYGAIMAWRDQFDNTDDELWTNAEIDALRDKSPARDFSWE